MLEKLFYHKEDTADSLPKTEFSIMFFCTRFSDRDYKEKYSFVKILYIAECDNINDIYNLEDLNKAILRNQKGFTWHKNDRFCYFKLPNELPRCEKFNEYVSIKIA